MRGELHATKVLLLFVLCENIFWCKIVGKNEYPGVKYVRWRTFCRHFFWVHFRSLSMQTHDMIPIMALFRISGCDENNSFSRSAFFYTSNPIILMAEIKKIMQNKSIFDKKTLIVYVSICRKRLMFIKCNRSKLSVTQPHYR